MTHKILTIFFTVLMVASIPAMPMISNSHSGVAAAQDSTSSNTDTLTCLSDHGFTTAISPLGNVIHCVNGSFDYSDGDSQTKLENQSYNNMISIQDSAESRQSEFTNWQDLSLAAALRQAEQPLIEAHSAGDDKGVARSEAQESLNDHYSAEISSEVNQHNQITERFVDIGTTINPTDTSGPLNPTLRSDSSTYIGGSDWSDAKINYQTATLPNGEEIEVAASVSTSSGDEAIYFPAMTQLDGVTQPSTSDYSVVAAASDLKMKDPYSSDTTGVAYYDQSNTRVSDILAEYDTAQGEIVTMADDLYNTYDQGEIDPDEYVSAGTLAEEYQGEDHYSYASALAAQNGLSTDLESSMIVEIGSEEYEGNLLASGVTTKIADTIPSDAQMANRADPVLQLDSSESDTVDLVAEQPDLTQNREILSVGNIADDSYSIDQSDMSVTFEKSGVQNSDGYTHDYVLIRTEADYDMDGDGTYEEKDRVGTTMIYTHTDVMPSNPTMEDIPDGIQVGQTYSASNFDSVLLNYQSGDKVDTKTVSSDFTVTQATDQSTGVDQISIQYDDGGQVSFEADNLQDRLETNNQIQNAIEQRSDNTSSVGGVGSFESGIFGFSIGVILIGGFVMFIVVLALLGRVTSIN